MPFISPDSLRDLVSLVYFSISALIVFAVARGIHRAKPRSKWTWLWLPATIVAVLYLPVSAKIGKWLDDREFAAKSAAQIAHFEMRCKSAGEFIHEKVKDVEGVFIIRPRVMPSDRHYQDQFDLWDPYGTSLFEGVGSRLPISTSLLSDAREWQPKSGESKQIKFERYLYVETHNPQHKSDHSQTKYLRYSYARNPEGELKLPNSSARADPEVTVLPSIERASRYGYIWEDISTREDREKWIAGGRLQVIDLESNRVIAERVGYLRESGLGSTHNNRLTWSFATRYSCPPLDGEHDKDKSFLSRVLIPKN